MDVEQTIRDYLPQIIHMSLATSRDNRPWVCELHFAYDDKLNLYFRSLLTRRHSKEILFNPRVAGNIVTQHQLEDGVRGVYFEGNARLITSKDELKVAFDCMKDRLNVGEEVLEEEMRPDGHKFFKVAVDRFYVFDSRESNPSQKYELAWPSY